jgi:kumamolisin
VLTDVGVNGATNSPGGPGDPEVALDIEVAGAVAQGARIAVYFTTWDENGWVLALKKAVHPRHGDPRPSVLSISWDWAEFGTLGNLTWSRSAIHAVHTAFREAAAFGVTVCWWRRATTGRTASSAMATHTCTTRRRTRG